LTRCGTLIVLQILPSEMPQFIQICATRVCTVSCSGDY
jgi:hypothetical protein